ncbi:unnamed protein product [Schistosoma turkestanicum]|nr:unnamed protein product [Schistosoma turkestanicum]
MEQSHSDKLAYFEETISDYDRQTVKLKNRINELQFELKRLTDDNNNNLNATEVKQEVSQTVETPVTTTSTQQPIISRHDVNVQCDIIKLDENNSYIDRTTTTTTTTATANNNNSNNDMSTNENRTMSSTELYSKVNHTDNTDNYHHSQSNDEYDDWIEKVRQEILHSDSIDALHPALRPSRYPTSVPIRDYEALQLHNTDLQNQLQQLSADFEALRSKCSAVCQSHVTESFLPSMHTMDNNNSNNDNGTVKFNHSNLPFNLISSDYQHVLLTSPNDNNNNNRLHELVEYEYLKNVLFEYMQGRETQTLSKVLCSLMRFNADQTRKVLSYEEQKTKTWTIRTVIE